MSHPAFSKLIEYWFGELGPEDEQRMEEHLFDCAHCSEQLGELAQLGPRIGSAFGSGNLRAVVSAPFLEKMKSAGLRLREYRVSPGESVRCTIEAADDAVVSRLEAPLAGVTRLDLVRLNEGGEVVYRLRDIPFDPAAGEVLFCPAAAALKKMPAHTGAIRLIAVDEAGERPLADYTFVHTLG